MSPHEAVRTTAGKDLDWMPKQELLGHLAKFSSAKSAS
jgi:hypothetical protein